jgi:hypothetical protein
VLVRKRGNIMADIRRGGCARTIRDPAARLGGGTHLPTQVRICFDATLTRRCARGMIIMSRVVWAARDQIAGVQ